MAARTSTDVSALMGGRSKNIILSTIRFMHASSLSLVIKLTVHIITQKKTEGSLYRMNSEHSPGIEVAQASPHKVPQSATSLQGSISTSSSLNPWGLSHRAWSSPDSLRPKNKAGTNSHHKMATMLLFNNKYMSVHPRVCLLSIPKSYTSSSKHSWCGSQWCSDTKANRMRWCLSFPCMPKIMWIRWTDNCKWKSRDLTKIFICLNNRIKLDLTFTSPKSWSPRLASRISTRCLIG